MLLVPSCRVEIMAGIRPHLMDFFYCLKSSFNKIKALDIGDDLCHVSALDGHMFIHTWSLHVIEIRC